MRIEALRPLRISRTDGDDLHLQPGIPVDVPEEVGARIIAKLPDLVHVRNDSSPLGYCPVCGSGFWTRPTAESDWQCGRCFPAEPLFESVFNPGGTLPPDSPVSPTPSPQPRVIEPALKWDGTPLSPIYWETGGGRILGPAVPEFLGRDGDSFWIAVTFEGQIRWVNADRLRSKRAFDAQFPSGFNKSS